MSAHLHDYSILMMGCQKKTCEEKNITLFMGAHERRKICILNT